MIKGRPITGSMLMGMAWEYVNVLNNGGVPTILSTYEGVTVSESRKFFEEILEMFNKTIEKEFPKEIFPLDEEEVKEKLTQIIKKLTDRFEKKITEFIDPIKVKQLRNELNDIFDKVVNEKCKFNDTQSDYACNKLLYTFFQKYKVPFFKTFEEINDGFIK